MDTVFLPLGSAGQRLRRNRLDARSPLWFLYIYKFILYIQDPATDPAILKVGLGKVPHHVHTCTTGHLSMTAIWP